MTGLDPAEWPLAPGNAPAEVEERFAAEAAAWPEPDAAMRDLVAGIMSRPARAVRRTPPNPLVLGLPRVGMRGRPTQTVRNPPCLT